MIRTGKAVFLADASTDQRTVQPIIRLGSARRCSSPSLSGTTRWGSPTVANARGGPPLREAAMELVETFAEQAAVVLEYARLQRLVRLEDQERIAKSCTMGHPGFVRRGYEPARRAHNGPGQPRLDPHSVPNLAGKAAGAEDPLDQSSDDRDTQEQEQHRHPQRTKRDQPRDRPTTIEY